MLLRLDTLVSDNKAPGFSHGVVYTRKQCRDKSVEQLKQAAAKDALRRLGKPADIAANLGPAVV
jgi:hypothetical protein